MNTFLRPQIAKYEPHNSNIISQSCTENETSKDGNCLETGTSFLRMASPNKIMKLQPDAFVFARHTLSSEILKTNFSACKHTRLKFYNGVIKFLDYNHSKMADLVIVAAMATERP